ncbi:MAG: substrate-binding domain-containing protein [Actinobacteria bacterium]|nr:substrate-binding domain-containing protein [Actinomycetota bacterium]
MPSSLRDVARKAKVSTGTVSNVLNRPEIVAPETLARVRKVIDELKFVPNGFARHLRSGQSRTIGLIIPDITNPFYTEVARGAEDAANKHDYAVFLCISDTDGAKETSYIGVLLEQRVRGVLIAPTDDAHKSVELLRSHHVGVALLDHKSVGSQECSVSVDHVRGGEIAIQHLADLGHKEIVWITGSEDYRQCVDRGIGVANIAERAGVELTIIPLKILNTSTGEEAAKKVMALEKRPTAIFCANDMLAFGVMRELLRMGIKVPQDISLIGYDDIYFAPTAAVPLSSIFQPAYQLGFTAAELLISECEDTGEHQHKQIVFDPELVARSSTAHVSTMRTVRVMEDISA